MCAKHRRTCQIIFPLVSPQLLGNVFQKRVQKIPHRQETLPGPAWVLSNGPASELCHVHHLQVSANAPWLVASVLSSLPGPAPHTHLSLGLAAFSLCGLASFITPNPWLTLLALRMLLLCGQAFIMGKPSPGPLRCLQSPYRKDWDVGEKHN